MVTAVTVGGLARCLLVGDVSEGCRQQRRRGVERVPGRRADQTPRGQVGVRLPPRALHSKTGLGRGRFRRTYSRPTFVRPGPDATRTEGQRVFVEDIICLTWSVGDGTCTCRITVRSEKGRAPYSDTKTGKLLPS